MLPIMLSKQTGRHQVTDTMKKILPKTYTIRTDQAVSLPDEVLALLGWGKGDDLRFEMDLGTNSLRLVKVPADKEVK
jgi:hypothetical protein